MQIVWLLSCCVSVVAVNSDDDDDEASARSYLSRHNPKQDVNEISKRGIGTYHSERGGVWAQKGPSSSGWDVGDTSMAECTMHTYFEPWVEDEVRRGGNAATVGAWKEAWSGAGWNTRVLSETDAATHPDFHMLKKKFEMLPTVNPPRYELACFLRWVAMAAVGGGWMSDYDVFPLGLPPCAPLTHQGNLTLYQKFVPSLVSGTGSEYLRVAHLIASVPWRAYPKLFSAHGSSHRPHVSDMLALRFFFLQTRSAVNQAREVVVVLSNDLSACGVASASDIFSLDSLLALDTATPATPAGPLIVRCAKPLSACHAMVGGGLLLQSEVPSRSSLFGSRRSSSSSSSSSSSGGSGSSGDGRKEAFSEERSIQVAAVREKRSNIPGSRSSSSSGGSVVVPTFLAPLAAHFSHRAMFQFANAAASLTNASSSPSPLAGSSSLGSMPHHHHQQQQHHPLLSSLSALRSKNKHFTFHQTRSAVLSKALDVYRKGCSTNQATP